MSKTTKSSLCVSTIIIIFSYICYRHPCKLPCHLNDCPRCEQPIRLPCHCRKNRMYIPCYQTNDKPLVSKLLCCGAQCAKEMANCTHPCLNICHEGPCMTECNQRVNVRCPCGNLKDKMACKTAQQARAKKGVQKEYLYVRDSIRDSMTTLLQAICDHLLQSCHWISNTISTTRMIFGNYGKI
jgi:hypothetical protein